MFYPPAVGFSLNKKQKREIRSACTGEWRSIPACRPHFFADPIAPPLSSTCHHQRSSIRRKPNRIPVLFFSCSFSQSPKLKDRNAFRLVVSTFAGFAALPAGRARSMPSAATDRQRRPADPFGRLWRRRDSLTSSPRC